MNSIFAALYSVVVILLGFPFLFACVAIVSAGTDALTQPFVQIFILSFPVIFIGLVFIQKALTKNK